MIDYDCTICPFCNAYIVDTTEYIADTGIADCVDCNFASNIKDGKYEIIWWRDKQYTGEEFLRYLKLRAFD